MNKIAYIITIFFIGISHYGISQKYCADCGLYKKRKDFKYTNRLKKILPYDDFASNMDSIFYIPDSTYKRLYGRISYDEYHPWKVIAFKKLDIYIPNKEGFKLTLNPCITDSTYSRLPFIFKKTKVVNNSFFARLVSDNYDIIDERLKTGNFYQKEKEEILLNPVPIKFYFRKKLNKYLGDSLIIDGKNLLMSQLYGLGFNNVVKVQPASFYINEIKYQFDDLFFDLSLKVNNYSSNNYKIDDDFIGVILTNPTVSIPYRNKRITVFKSNVFISENIFYAEHYFKYSIYKNKFFINSGEEDVIKIKSLNEIKKIFQNNNTEIIFFEEIVIENERFLKIGFINNN